MIRARTIAGMLCACLLSCVVYAEDIKVLVFDGQNPIQPAYNAFTISTELNSILVNTPEYSGSSVAYEDMAARSLLESWYAPAYTNSTCQKLDGDYDVVILMSCSYIGEHPPEAEFEAVLQISKRVLNNGGSVFYMMDARSESNLPIAADNAYRIANGCGVNVIPGGLAAYEAGLLMPESSTDKSRQAYLIAATIYSRLTGRSARDSGYGSELALADLAQRVVSDNKDAVHYSGGVSDSGVVRYRPIDATQPPFNGTVRYVFCGTSTENGIHSHLPSVIQAQGLTAGGVSVSSTQGWYPTQTAQAQSTFNAYPHQYLFLYARDIDDWASNLMGTNQMNLLPIRFDKQPGSMGTGVSATIAILNIGSYSGPNYSARNNARYGCNAILFRTAVGRFFAADPTLVGSTDGVHMSTPLYWMTASMMISSALGTNPVPPAAVSGNSQYLTGFNIGHRLVKELAFLSEDGRDIPDTDLQIDTPFLPVAYTGLLYQVTLAANGGTPLYTWEELSDDGLPSGFSFSTNGVLSGTPTTIGTNILVFKVTDANHAIRKKALAIAVNDPAPNNSPIITAESISVLTATSATFNVTVVSTGSTPTEVYFYCGTSDAGVSNAAWQYELPLGMQGEVVVSTNLTGLTDASTYYWRAFATNNADGVWSPFSMSFSTPPDVSGYTNSMSITNVGYNRSETLVNFPLLLKFSTAISGFSYAGFSSPNGYDLRFTDAAGVQEYDCEIESWNPSGTSCVWVCVPQFESNCEIKAFWGDPAATNQRSSSTNGSTWKAAYQAVYHMAGTNSVLPDASQHADGHDCTVSGTVTRDTPSAIGTGVYLDGTNGFIVPGSPDPGYWHNVAWRRTWSAWVTLENTTNRAVLIEEGGAAYGFGLSYDADTDRMVWSFRVNASETWTNSAPVLSGGALVHVVAVYDVGTLKLYLNGAQSAVLEKAQIMPAHSNDPTIGSQNGSAAIGGDHVPWRGQIDEVRCSDVVRSADWIWASYITVVSNATTITYTMDGP